MKVSTVAVNVHVDFGFEIVIDAAFSSSTSFLFNKWLNFVMDSNVMSP